MKKFDDTYVVLVSKKWPFQLFLTYRINNDFNQTF